MAGLEGRLAELATATPALLLDLDTVDRAYRTLLTGLPGVRLHYAVKCNPDLEVLRTLHRAGCSFEVASWPELALLLDLGVRGRDVLFSNPVKPVEHVRRCAQAGVRWYAVDGFPELRKLAALVPGRGVLVRLAVPAAGGTVGSEGKFGVDERLALALLLEARALGLGAYGVAFHVGSQTTDVRGWDRAIAAAGRVVAAARDHGLRVRLLDLGGGFPARYGTPVPSATEFGAALRAACAAHLPGDVSLAAEPGRAMVAEAGLMVATVIGVAERGRRRWVHLDVGALNGFIEALESRRGLRFPMSAPGVRGPLVPWSVTGPTCDSQDTIAHDVPLPRNLAAGDRVLVGTAGAYTVSCAASFNGFPAPVVVHHRGGAPLARTLPLPRPYASSNSAAGSGSRVTSAPRPRSSSANPG